MKIITRLYFLGNSAQTILPELIISDNNNNDRSSKGGIRKMDYGENQTESFKTENVSPFFIFMLL